MILNSTVGVHTDKSNDSFKQLLNEELYMEEVPLVDRRGDARRGRPSPFPGETDLRSRNL